MSLVGEEISMLSNKSASETCLMNIIVDEIAEKARDETIVHSQLERVSHREAQNDFQHQ